MMKGTVKWFNDQKGYGFIIGEDGKEYFVHFSSITGEGYRTLKEGAEVTFESTSSDKGFEAKQVIISQ